MLIDRNGKKNKDLKNKLKLTGETIDEPKKREKIQTIKIKYNKKGTSVSNEKE